MYNLINNNVGLILDSEKLEHDVDAYVWLVGQFPTVDVSRNDEFQKKFRQYWQLNQARFSKTFIKAYFELLQSLKGGKKIGVEETARKLYKIPTHGKRQTLQFSFSTKLNHMLYLHAPVYDSTVEAFFFLPRASAPNRMSAQRKTEVNLKRLLLAHDFLTREYARVLEQSLLAEAVTQFRTRYDQRSVLTEEKVIDTLIWRFVTLLRSGALRDGKVLYT